MTISFVIRTKNEARDIEDTLKNIRMQKCIYDVEIVLVDSGSKDSTIEIAKPYIDKLIKIKPEEFTWGSALNKGICQCSGDWIALISGHCNLKTAHTLQTAVDIASTSNIAALYGQQLGVASKDIFECIELLTEYPALKYHEFGLEEICKNEEVGVSSACSLIKKEVWDIVKFDEQIQSAEDACWAYKVAETGYRLAYSSEFSVYHGHPLDIVYVYTKHFWRVYCTRLGDQKLQHQLTVRNIASHYLIKPIIQLGDYYNTASMHNIPAKRKAIYFYLLVKNIAEYNAKKAIKKNTVIKSYHDLKAPALVHKLALRLNLKNS